MFSAAGILTWFATSKLGRALAAGLGIAIAIGIALLKAFSAGKSAARMQQTKASLDNLRKRQKTDDDIQTLGASDVDRRLSRWVRDE